MSGPSSFEMMQQMGPSAGGASNHPPMGTFRSLFGIDIDGSPVSTNFTDEKHFNITGFEGMNCGFGALFENARGSGKLGELFQELFGGLHDNPFANTPSMDGLHHSNNMDGMHNNAMAQQYHNNSGGGDSGSSGTTSSSSSAGNHQAFSSLPNMDTAGPISHVPTSMLGGLSPRATPGMGQSREVERG